MTKDEIEEAMPGQQWKCGDEFLPFHPQASHVSADYRDGWNACFLVARAHLEGCGGVPEGWRMVPVEPTPEMIRAGSHGKFRNAYNPEEESYAAMLDAAPPAPSAAMAKGEGA